MQSDARDKVRWDNVIIGGGRDSQKTYWTGIEIIAVEPDTLGTQPFVLCREVMQPTCHMIS